MLEGIPRQSVPAMVVDGLESRAGEEDHALAGGHAGELEGDARTDRVEEETFKRVIIKGAVGVGDIKAVVAGMEGCWNNGLAKQRQEMDEKRIYCKATCSYALLDVGSIAMYRPPESRL